jgi:tellurite resistance protein
MIAIAVFFIIVLTTLMIQLNQNVKVKSAASTAKQVAIDQRKGRRVSINFTCGALKAVINAGRDIITGNEEVSPLESALLKQFNISEAVVKQFKQKAADDYTNNIVLQIENYTKVRGIVDENGDVDCEKLQSISKAD